MSTEPIIHQCECKTCKIGLDTEIIKSHQRINLFLSRLNEPQRRWYVATLAEETDAPSDRQLALITGLDEKTIRRGKVEMQDQLVAAPVGRQRQEGAGRWRAEKKTRR
ncbi:MAG: hypothetical protein Q8L64_02475 [bacterium]|nr:hypothetical protein [bacterium]